MTTKLYSPLLALKLLFRQLWLSVSSVNFYERVYKQYSGYGIKYLFTLSFISSVIYCAISLNYIIILKDYLTLNKQSKYTANLEYIIKQLPEIHYDGKNITINEETPLFLYSRNEGKIGVIDPNNQLSFNERSKIPIVFTNNKILISFIWDKKKINLPIEYSTLLGTNEQILSPELIKAHFATIFTNVPSLFIYVLTPVMIILTFVFTLFRASFLVIIIYLMMQLFGPITNIQTCIRMVLFSNGAHTLLEPLITSLVPQLHSFTWLILLWTYMLLILSILKIRNSN